MPFERVQCLNAYNPLLNTSEFHVQTPLYILIPYRTYCSRLFRIRRRQCACGVHRNNMKIIRVSMPIRSERRRDNSLNNSHIYIQTVVDLLLPAHCFYFIFLGGGLRGRAI